MSSKYFFKLGDQHYVIGKLREFFYSRIYLKTPGNKMCSNVFDASMQSMLADYQKHHGLKSQSAVLNLSSLLNEETYEQIGKEMSTAEIDSTSLYDPDVKKLLYGVIWGDVCADWETIPPVIPKDKFVGWGHANVTENCFDYCRAQLKKVGQDMKQTWWGPADKMNANIYQLYLTEDVAGMKKGVQVKQFTNGVLYLKTTLKNKIPVVVGVEDAPGSPNADKVTDHFVVIVGMGSDVTGKYFLFYDNATSDKDEGTSDQNRLYCLCNEFMIKGTGTNAYVLGSQYKSYTVTQIRESR